MRALTNVFRWSRALLVASLTMGAGAALASGCAEDDPGPSLASELGVGEMGMRRLTAHEYDNIVEDLLGDDTRPGFASLPEDVRSPFDNGWHTQEPSQLLVESAELLAGDVATRLAADPARRDQVVGCTPTGPSDQACLTSFIAHFGRLAWRRPLTAAETDQLAQLGQTFALQEEDFYQGVEVVLRVFLQSAEMLYRIELGTPVEGQPGLFALSGYEIATRMAFLLWASTPDDALLDKAAEGALGTPESRAAVAQQMLEDPRARRQLDRFHALWLGYEALPHAPALTAAMRQESAALVQQIVFDEPSSWLELFLYDQTFIDDTLASHYGLPATGATEPAWVSLQGSERRGLLSLGAFLSAASNPLDTSPTKRGKLVQERLLCNFIEPPPPDAPSDEPPSAELGECKIDQYSVHSAPGCSDCHAPMDGVGFGLENYDREGRYRAHDDGKPQCTITGNGLLPGAGAFNGPAELGQLIVDSGKLDACAVHYLTRFNLGRPVSDADQPYLDALTSAFQDNGHLFDQLLVEAVKHPAFGYRLDVTEEK